jgi:hypothetical protein
MSVSLAVRRPTGYGGTALRFVDEKRAVYVHGAGAVVLDVSTGDVDFFVCGGARGVSCVAASPNTGTLAVAKRERNPCIQVYQYPTKRLKASLRGGTDLEFVDMAFSRDGTQLAAIAALTDYKFTIWNVEDGSVVVQAKLPQSCVGVAFDPSSTADLATWGKHGVYFWKVKAVMGERELTSIKGELPDEDMVKDAMREDGDSGSGNEDGEDSADSDSEDEYGDGAAADERQADTEMEHDLQRRLGVFTAAAYGPDGSLYVAAPLLLLSCCEARAILLRATPCTTYTDYPLTSLSPLPLSGTPPTAPAPSPCTTAPPGPSPGRSSSTARRSARAWPSPAPTSSRCGRTGWCGG